jgi:two-component system sensor histidine kinase LytS
MLFLFIDMLERIGFLIALAFVISRSKWMRSYMSYQREQRNQWRFIFFFSLYAILGTYSGVVVSNFSYQASPLVGHISQMTAIANSRTVGVVIAGIFGGVRSGAIVGLIAGLQRYSLGGFVAVACGIAPILQGIFAGLMRNSFKKRFRQSSSVKMAWIIGLFAEVLQMLLILLLASPWKQALDLVLLIGIPQILTNSAGVAVFFMLNMQMTNEEERIGAVSASKALQTADQTLTYWNLPFEKAIQGVTHILVSELQATGVFFYRGEEQLASEGRRAAFWIDVPLVKDNKTQIGTFRLYFPRREEINSAKELQMSSLGQLLSQQYAFAESGKQARLLADSEIRALQAQMNPHFLFNVLNTITSFIRSKPDEARRMTLELAKFLRQNMHNSNQPLVRIRDELELVSKYLNLIKARKGDQLESVMQVDEEALELWIPPFTIQPLVENAIVHGLKQAGRSGKIVVSVKLAGEAAEVTIEDNGVGMKLSENPVVEEHMGMALANVEQRLCYHFGVEHALHIESEINQGTKISFWVR